MKDKYIYIVEHGLVDDPSLFMEYMNLNLYENYPEMFKLSCFKNFCFSFESAESEAITLMNRLLNDSKYGLDYGGFCETDQVTSNYADKYQVVKFWAFELEYVAILKVKVED